VTQVHLEAHDPQHVAEPDLIDKGLQHDSVGLLASVLLSVSPVAPAYALTATLGLTVTEVGVQAPAIFLVGFIPMLLAASAYRELNKVAPDAGTSFTWTVKAFGPHIGWMCGWGLVAAIIIVLSNLAGVAVTFFYLFLTHARGRLRQARGRHRGPGVRQRRLDLRPRHGVRARHRHAPDRRRGDVRLAGPLAGLLPRRDAQHDTPALVAD
jgi:hypothetical protein